MPMATEGGPASGGAAAAGGMGAMMGAMMTPKPPGGCVGGDCGSGVGQAPIYPSLMTLPTLPNEKRAEIDALASQQTAEGMARLSKGIEALDLATRAEDEAAKQQAVGLMHEALNEVEAGIAARRVLSEGKAPRNLALDWFKREMSLASPVVHAEPKGLLGLTAMHLFTMALLISFAFAMLGMYYFKMRRAANLFGRIEPDAGSQAPGSPKPGGKDQPVGAPPPPATPPKGNAPAASTVEKSPVPLPAPQSAGPTPPEGDSPKPSADKAPVPAPSGQTAAAPAAPPQTGPPKAETPAEKETS